MPKPRPMKGGRPKTWAERVADAKGKKVMRGLAPGEIKYRLRNKG